MDFNAAKIPIVQMFGEINMERHLLFVGKFQFFAKDAQ